MRSDHEIDKGIQLIEGRVDRDAEYMEDDPLAPLIMSIWQAKRAALRTVEQDEGHWELYDRLREGLAVDVELVEYVQIQAMLNALEWAHGNTDSL